MTDSKPEAAEVLPPPPPDIPQNLVPPTNYFNVKLRSTSDFYQFSVALTYEDGNVGKRVFDMVPNLYSSELDGVAFVYDGEKNLFSVGPLRRAKLEFPVLLENLSSNRTVREGSTSEGETKSLNALQGIKSEQFHEAVRVLDVFLRQQVADSLIDSSGITISTMFAQLEGRVLAPPKFGSGGDLLPRGGRWNSNNKTLLEPSTISCWAIVNFSAHCDINVLHRVLRRASQAKGMNISEPYTVIDENHQARRNPAPVRTDMMFEAIKQALSGPPSFLLCIFPERKNSYIYGPWKRNFLADFGIVTLCIALTRINDQHITNLLLKINSKMVGIKSLLAVEHLSKIPTLILRRDVYHGSPGRSDVALIAAAVSSREWPLISRYRASVCAQSERVEMIGGLFQPVAADKDDSMISHSSFLVNMGRGGMVRREGDPEYVRAYSQRLQTSPVLPLPLTERGILLDRVHRFGLTLVRVNGDGNCLFRSIAKIIYGSEEEYAFVRGELVDEMRSNPEMYIRYGLLYYPRFNEDGYFINSYVKRMSRDRVWGDIVVVFAAANRYTVRVNIISSTTNLIGSTHVGATTDIWDEVIPSNLHFKDDIYLAYKSSHYDALFKDRGVVENLSPPHRRVPSAELLVDRYVVSGLPYDVDDEDLKYILRDAGCDGDITVRVVHNSGYAYVWLPPVASNMSALTILDGQEYGRSILSVTQATRNQYDISGNLGD